MRKPLLILFLMLSAGVIDIRAQAGPQPTPRPAENEPETSVEKQPKYEAQFHITQESLTKGLGSWRFASFYMERRFKNHQIVWGTYRVSSRNAVRDQEFSGGIYKKIGGKWAAMTEIMFSPTHKYVGKFSIMGEVERPIGRGFVGHGGVRFTKYDSIKATSVYGMLEKYWGNNRAAYTIYLSNLSNAGSAPSHRVQLTRYFGEDLNSVSGTFAFGREHENLGPQIGILRNDTWSVGISGRYWLTKRIGLNVDGLLHRQGDLYYRRGMNIGLRYRF